MNCYKTSEIAKIMGVHPNTVRLYEEWELIPKPQRQPNGYRVFTDFHIEQFKLARLAFRVEVLQNGLRKRITRVVKVSATGDFDRALALADDYVKQLLSERANAEEAASLVRAFLSDQPTEDRCALRRKDVSELLHLSVDTLRNWEMNGLLTVKRKENGYRVYTSEDIQRLKIIRSLRCANYSLESILQMLHRLSHDPSVDIVKALDTPQEDTDIIAVCDKLITSLGAAEDNARQMIAMLETMKIKFNQPST